jgi:DNA polymerase I-like protein with 3'-5' exonuclease and polymerase domains
LKYQVFDLETQNHKSKKRVANPFDPRNYVVMRGWKVEGASHGSMTYHTGKDPSNILHIDDDVDVLVGFNIKFDLLFEMVADYNNLAKFYKRGGRVWCCQYAEYLLRGQRRKFHMCSLDQIIESYGGRKKIDGVKALWEAGVLTADIDKEMLHDYLCGTKAEGRDSGDIGNTELIYKGQVEEAKALGMYEGILARMDGLACTTEMEYNGIKVEWETATRNMALSMSRKDEANNKLEAFVRDIPAEVKFSWTSPIHKSCLIFGGRIKYSKQDTYLDIVTGKLARLVATERWPLFGGDAIDPAKCVWSESKGCWAFKGPYDETRMCWYEQDRYVSGKKIDEPKYKNVKGWGELKVKYQDFYHDLPGYTKPRDKWKSVLLDGNGDQIYSTASEVIEIISKRNIPFLVDMGIYQRMSKELSTYYAVVNEKGEATGMLTCVGEDGIVHHMLNHNTTVTTRLASSNPNMQNIPRADWDDLLEDVKSRVKEMFASRFTWDYCEAHGLPYDTQPGWSGVMGEIDYSQLEVVVQGLLSLDKHLCRDLRNKIDFHCKRVALKNSVSYGFALEHCKNSDAKDFKWWKAERTGCKIFSFQRAYGAGAHTIADETGISVQDIKDMIALEEKEYPGVVKFNISVERAVIASAVWFPDPERGWRKFRRGQWQSPTGTIYEFRSWDAPKFLREQGIMDSFSPPEMKNYPVQGTGGEVVQIALGKLWRLFVATDNFGGLALLVNTVHDCVWVDMHDIIVDIVMPAMMKVMEAIPYYLKQLFGMECPVPFPVDGEVGPNMLDLHHYQPQGET